MNVKKQKSFVRKYQRKVLKQYKELQYKITSIEVAVDRISDHLEIQNSRKRPKLIWREKLVIVVSVLWIAVAIKWLLE